MCKRSNYQYFSTEHRICESEKAVSYITKAFLSQKFIQTSNTIPIWFSNLSAFSLTLPSQFSLCFNVCGCSANTPTVWLLISYLSQCSFFSSSSSSPSSTSFYCIFFIVFVVLLICGLLLNLTAVFKCLFQLYQHTRSTIS